MKKILLVVGTRPNFIKIANFKSAAEEHNMLLKIVHTGQHYDVNLSEVFFTELGIQPDYFLQMKETESVAQRAEINRKLKQLVQEKFFPDLIIVVGDVNSTRAAAETASELKIKIAHVESGLRSFDNSMPEEINRIITDKLSDYLFVTEKSGEINLLNEGKSAHQIYFVGNTMIDTLIKHHHQINNNLITNHLSLENEEFILLTLHRPSNVDKIDDLIRSVELIEFITTKMKVVFPIHPRTYNKLAEHHLITRLKTLHNLKITEPLNYFAFQKLILCCNLIITDSGGIQEESTFRNKPCITIRQNTERPSTIQIGSNTLSDWKLSSIGALIDSVKNNTYKISFIPPLWDGLATSRLFQVLADID